MEKIDEVTLRRENTEHLFKIGKLLSDICPPASRFYMSNVEKRINEFPDLLKNKNKVDISCRHCGSIWKSTNLKFRIQPTQQLNTHIRKLSKIQKTEYWKLNNKQKKKLRKYYDSTSKIVYKCLICQKTTTFHGSKANSSTTAVNTSTPINKLKVKRSDVNAGLFIPSPIVSSEFEKNKLDNSEISNDTDTKMLESSVTSCDSFSISSNVSNSTNSSSKHESSFPSFKASPESSSKQQLSMKRKKTLLAQILNQEQKKKKKTTLSSFLVSL